MSDHERYLSGAVVTANATGSRGVVIGDVFRQAPDGYRWTAAVAFDDGSSGCVRIAALTLTGERVLPEAVERRIAQENADLLSELADQYRASGSASVANWLAAA